MKSWISFIILLVREALTQVKAYREDADLRQRNLAQEAITRRRIDEAIKDVDRVLASHSDVPDRMRKYQRTDK